VHAAAVIGVPHTQLGEEVGAVLQVDAPDAATEARVRACVAGKLAAFKQPTRYWLRATALPVGATGKILKREIRQEVLGG
jgi:acyl-CoA synthetase (AMP-forming)/AMP-acid ligase II